MVALVLASLSGGYIYAAQGGASAQDKKQLGLFNGNDEFIGTLIGMQTAYATGGIEYQAYSNTIDAIIRISNSRSGRASDNSVFALNESPSGALYFSMPNCAGNSFLYAAGISFEAEYLQQMLFSSTNPNKQFVIQSTEPLFGIQVQSQLGDDGSCENFPTPEMRDELHSVVEVSVPYVLTGKPRIKTL